ncbi:hypothetical protein BGZ99_000067 [Dissophora globulifera]|uniref:Uncharacterized protein n=1 Tax=Dissophora globulifera TaxID=979702 RepID=A0A9P6RU21_9FUNG|nr:hypothetical protein BGZ99_000067 [Dissophora globulifera]
MNLCRDNIGDFCHGGELQDFMDVTGFSAALDALPTMPDLPQDQQDVLDSLFKGKVTLEELSERTDGRMKIPNPVPELNRYLFTSFQPFCSILMNGGINQDMNERQYFRDFVVELLRGALSVHNIPYMWPMILMLRDNASAARQHSPLSPLVRAHRNRLQEMRQQPNQPFKLSRASIALTTYVDYGEDIGGMFFRFQLDGIDLVNDCKIMPTVDNLGCFLSVNAIWDTAFDLDLKPATIKQISKSLTKPQFKFAREDQLLLLDLKALTRQPRTGNNELQDALIHIFHSFEGRLRNAPSLLGGLVFSSAPSYILEQVGQMLGDMIRCYIRAFVSELKKRVAIWSPEWAKSQEGSAFLETIGDNGLSPLHDPLSVFWVLNTTLPTSKRCRGSLRFAYLPMLGYKDKVCVISESQLLQAILRPISGKETRGKVVKLFGSTKDASSSTYKQAKVNVKAAIKNHILNSGGCARSRKYVLADTLHTDGYQLKIHAYSLAHPKKKAETSGNHSAETSTSTNRLEAASASSTSSTRSKMKYLKEAIPNLETLQKEFGDQDSHVIFAIYPGIKNTATAVITDSLVPTKAWNVVLSRGSHVLSSQRHAQMPERHKKDRRYRGEGTMSVYDLESDIKPLQTGDDSGRDLALRFKNIKDSFQEYSKTVFVVEKDLREFYGSKSSKVAKYRKDQGEKAEVGRAIGGMIKATRAQADMPNVEKRKALVVIGDGDFRGKNGGPVQANKFITQLQSRE